MYKPLAITLFSLSLALLQPPAYGQDGSTIPDRETTIENPAKKQKPDGDKAAVVDEEPECD